MLELQRRNKGFTVIALALQLLILVACGDCEQFSHTNIAPREGHVRIDTIYLKWGDHAYTAANKKTGEVLLFNGGNFPISPKVGDSLVKRRGELEYTLYTKDSVYVERFDCTSRSGIIVSEKSRDR